MVGYRSNDGCKFRFLSPDGTIKVRNRNVLCDHVQNINLLSLEINRNSYLAVSCGTCKTIRLLDLWYANKEPIVAFKGEVGPMSLGQNGTLYTFAKGGYIVLKLDCTKRTFVHETRASWELGMQLDNLCYMTKHDAIALSSWGNTKLCAVSSNGEKIWNGSKQLERELFRWEPCGMAYLSEQDLLLVADKYKRRILCT